MITYIINEKWQDDYHSSISSASSYYPRFMCNVTGNESLQSKIAIEEIVTVEVNQNHISSSPVERILGIVSSSK